jgi:uncharacterized protein YgfB (UPF0149 family)
VSKFPEINAWRAEWMERAASALHDAAHLIEDHSHPTDDSVDVLARIAQLQADEWDDADEDES